MKELLYRYYLIKLSDYIEDTKDSLYFTINDKKYHFFVVHRDLEEIEDILKITDDLLKRNVLIYSPIKNINVSFITIENNNYYVLLDESGDNKEITLLEIIDFTNKTRIINNIKSKLYRNDWYTLWQEKINYLEYQVSELGKQYPVIVSSFSYYRGLSENALCYVKYLEKIQNLKDEYEKLFKGKRKAAAVFLGKFPYRYLLREFGIDYYAAFPGCSSETEASFETIAFLSKKIDELKANAVLLDKTDDEAVARSVIKNTKAQNAKILYMDSMQSANKEYVAENNYLGIMENNLKSLYEAVK